MVLAGLRWVPPAPGIRGQAAEEQFVTRVLVDQIAGIRDGIAVQNDGLSVGLDVPGAPVRTERQPQLRAGIAGVGAGQGVDRAIIRKGLKRATCLQMATEFEVGLVK